MAKVFQRSALVVEMMGHQVHGHFCAFTAAAAAAHNHGYGSLKVFAPKLQLILEKKKGGVFIFNKPQTKLLQFLVAASQTDFGCIP